MGREARSADPFAGRGVQGAEDEGGEGDAGEEEVGSAHGAIMPPERLAA